MTSLSDEFHREVSIWEKAQDTQKIASLEMESKLEKVRNSSMLNNRFLKRRLNGSSYIWS